MCLFHTISTLHFSNGNENAGSKQVANQVSPPAADESSPKEREAVAVSTPTTTANTEKPERVETPAEPSKEPEPSTVAPEPPTEETKDLKRHISEDDDELKKKKRKEESSVVRGTLKQC